MGNQAPPASAADCLADIWRLTGLDESALKSARLDLAPSVLPTSFRVADMATATVAASGLAAAELWRLRTGAQQTVTVSSRHAEIEFSSEQYLRVDGQPAAELWGAIAGLYQCGDGRWVRIHANYPHHQAGVLEVLQCSLDKDEVAETLRNWTAEAFEAACSEKGLVVFMMRSQDEWRDHEQAVAISPLPLIDIERIGDAPVEPLPPNPSDALTGVSVLDLTRVIAGPVCGRTLAAYGAEVLRVSAARLPRDPKVLEIDGGRGKRSVFIDLKTAAGRAELESHLTAADVFVQGYRPGALDDLGFAPERLAALRPGIVSVSISAWGHVGPWARRRGFDSLVQTATGINWAEAEAAGVEGPKPLPCQALDFASGYLMTMGAMAGLYKRATEGGSWRVRVALARTGRWLQSLGRIDDGFRVSAPNHADIADLLLEIPSDYGLLTAVKHPVRLSSSPVEVGLAPQPYPGSLDA